MLIRTYADIEKLEGDDALSEAERLLIENCRMGEPTVLGDGSVPEGPRSQRTIRAGLLRYLLLGGCSRCQVHERGVVLVGAWIKDNVDLEFAQAKALTLMRCGFEKSFLANQSSFESVVLNGSNLPGWNAEGAAIKGNVSLEGVKSQGTVLLSGAEIGGYLLCDGAHLSGGNGKAFDAHGGTIKGGVFLRGLKSQGEISFHGAEIGGELACQSAELTGGKGMALNAQDAAIKQSVRLDGLKGHGVLSLSGAKIGGQLSCDCAELTGTNGESLNAEVATISGGVFLGWLISHGEVSFAGAEIGGQFSCQGAELNGRMGKALNGQGMTVGDSFFWRQVKCVTGIVDLNGAHLSNLVDDQTSWGLVSDLNLVGMTYENLIGPSNLSFRRGWLRMAATQGGQFHPQPYQHLAKFYRESGHRYEAREILVAKEIEQRKATRKAIREGKARSESWVQPDVLATVNLAMDMGSRLVAGYGYKPLRSLVWIAALVAIMMGLAQLTWNAGDFAPNSAVILTSPDWKAIADGSSENPAADWSGPAAPGKDYETFYAFAYALDVVVPVLDLGQTDAWAPSPARGDWGYRLFYLQKMFVVLGWVVTAIAAAAISGMIRRDD